MAEYIEREEIFRRWNVMPAPASLTSLAAAISQTPAADVAPVVHGRWKLARYTEAPLYLCSECDKPEYKQHKFCPNCGARMDLEAT